MTEIVFEKIITKRFILRQFRDDDIEDVFKGLSHPDVIKYYGVSYSTLESTKEQMNWFADIMKNGTGIWWAICCVRKGTFVGAGGLSDINDEHRKAEIGFWLLPEYWKQGIMTEVAPAICNYGFEKLSLHRILSIVETKNTACNAAMKTLNFKYEGTMEEAEYKNGEYIDLNFYAKINR